MSLPLGLLQYPALALLHSLDDKRKGTSLWGPLGVQMKVSRSGDQNNPRGEHSIILLNLSSKDKSYLLGITSCSPVFKHFKESLLQILFATI